MDMKEMMKQAQKMQRDAAAAQQEIAAMTFEASAGGGMVKATATGEMAITDITIDPAAVDPEDVEMLQDMVVAAVNEALRAAERGGQRPHERRHGRHEDPRPDVAGPSPSQGDIRASGTFHSKAPRRAGASARRGTEVGPAHGLLDPEHRRRRGAASGRCYPRGEGGRAFLRPLLQLRRGRFVRDLRQLQARPARSSAW